MEIWQHISKVVAFWLKLPKSKQPKCISFESVKEAIEDELTTVKFSFFGYLTSIFQPFLAKYQTLAQMIPYTYSDIVKLIRSLMQVVVKHGIIDGCMFDQDLQKIDLDKENVYKKRKEFNLGFAAENKLKALQIRDLVKKEAITNFLDNVHSCVVAILKKMFEKSPIGSVRNASVFSPNSTFVTKEDLLKNLKLLQHFVKIRVLTAAHADKASIQYGEFLKNDMKLVKEDDDINHLDVFFFTKLDAGMKYPELTKVIIIIPTLSHGQADIERGFSQNKTVLQQNIKEDSISSKRMIKDHMLANKLRDCK